MQMLKGTDHPTREEEFHALYTRSLEDVLSTTRGVYLRKGSLAAEVREKALALLLRDVGYVFDEHCDLWRFCQAGYKGSFPKEWLKLPLPVLARRLADLAITMSNQRVTT